MKKTHTIFGLIIIITFITSCARTFYKGPNVGRLYVKLYIIADTNGVVKTLDGIIIGKINEKGKIFDLSGNKIGRREPTMSELYDNYTDKNNNPYE